MPRPSGPIFTGNVRHRVGWFGRLILQVEVMERVNYADPVEYGRLEAYWRDAKSHDIYGLNWVRRDLSKPPINSPPSPRKK
jgi:hypothetical protein